jgi:hypothetical protein
MYNDILVHAYSLWPYPIHISAGIWIGYANVCVGTPFYEVVSLGDAIILELEEALYPNGIVRAYRLRG